MLIRRPKDIPIIYNPSFLVQDHQNSMFSQQDRPSTPLISDELLNIILDDSASNSRKNQKNLNCFELLACLFEKITNCSDATPAVPSNSPQNTKNNVKLHNHSRETDSKNIIF